MLDLDVDVVVTILDVQLGHTLVGDVHVDVGLTAFIVALADVATVFVGLVRVMLPLSCLAEDA